MNGFPAAYAGRDPMMSLARLLTRRTVPSRSSRNRGTGASWNTARSIRRSARTGSARRLGAPGGRVAGLPRGERVDRSVEFRERRIQEGLELGAGQAGRLLQGVPPGGELGEVGLGRRENFPTAPIRWRSLSGGAVLSGGAALFLRRAPVRRRRAFRRAVRPCRGPSAPGRQRCCGARTTGCAPGHPPSCVLRSRVLRASLFLFQC